MKNDAEITLIFYSFYDNPLYDKIVLNDEEFKIETGKIIKKFTFDKYELDLGKKYCSYKLITKNGEDEITGAFEISLGNHIGFCFLDDPGMTYKILFLQKKEEINDFITGKYTLSINNPACKNKEFELSMNRNETLDRASLILINCFEKSLIKRDGKVLIELINFERKINIYDKYNSYQICFHYNNFQDFAYQKVKNFDKLNFDDIYSNNQKEINEIYDILKKIIDKRNKNEAKELIIDFINHCKKNKEMMAGILRQKYLYGKKLLEEELNKESYTDFIFNIISIKLVEGVITNEENFEIDDLKDIYNKFYENKKIIDKDKNLKVYEKIFILIDIYTSDLLYEEDYKVHYYDLKNIEEKSPLFYAKDFLNNFIESLDYDSNFYYPLLSIDSGNYEYNYITKNSYKFISTYGFNMFSLDTIKNHLKNMIPDVILSSKYISDDNARTNPLNGNIILNSKKFENIKIDKKELDESKSKHYASIIAKILIHEIFGHKKSSFSKLGVNYDSVISFKDELGELKLIDSEDNNKNIFKDINEIDGNKNIDLFTGDSGYFIEYFLGKINDEYTIAIIDTIEEDTNLSKLLDPKLWHKEISILKEYLKLKSIFIFSFPKENLDNNTTIYEEIKYMKKKIEEEIQKSEGKDKKSNEKEQKSENKDSNKNTKIKVELNSIIDEKFNSIWKKRKNIIISKGKSIQSPKKNEKKKYRNKELELLFKGYTHGFYRK